MLLRVTLIKVLFLVLLISACSKRTVNLEAIEHQVKLKTSMDSSSRLQVKTSTLSKAFHISDEQSEYQVTIKPKGHFKINAAGEFEGEADSILIKGKAKKSAAAGQTVSGTRDSTAVTDLNKKTDYQEKEKSKKKETESKRPDVISILLLVLFGAISVWCFYLFSSLYRRAHVKDRS